MLFSSPIFLFCFLPAALLLDRLGGRRVRSLLLLALSLLFYAWGEPVAVLLILASIVVNDLAARAIARGARWLLPLAICLNLAPLFYFKYGRFLWETAARGLEWVGIASGELAQAHLPIGISFFTFQAISYLVDVARKEVEPAESPVLFGLYLSLFPQLVAGPIVRYREVAPELAERKVELAAAADGMRRFIRGLAKKVIIADGLAGAVDGIYAVPGEGLGAGVAWFAAVAYSLQIYYDFSGYSDMAIGLGSMLGLRFPENFDRPYATRSITEFWRRWHMTLSRWFRDYVYIPLAGTDGGHPGRFSTCSSCSVFAAPGMAPIGPLSLGGSITVPSW